MNNLRLNTNIPPPLELYTPTLSTTTWRFPNRNSPTGTPLTPPHPMFATQPPTRLHKSLQGATCCFCAESLEYTLAGEKVVVFECAHTSHHECLLQLVDQTKVRRAEHRRIESFMPQCAVCGEVCVPLDESILMEIVHPDNDTGKNTAVRKCSTASDSDASNFSHISHSSISSFDSFDLGIARSAVTTPTTPSSAVSTSFYFSSPVSTSGLAGVPGFISTDNISHNTVFEISPAIPSAVLRARKAQIPAVEIETTPEFASASTGEYITTLVTIRAPPVPTHPSFMEPIASVSNRRAATQRIRNLVPDWKQLDFERFGLLRLVDTCHVASKREGPWRMLDCYLFDTMLVLVRGNSGRGDKKRSFSGASLVSTALSVQSAPSTSSFTTFATPMLHTHSSSESGLPTPAAPVVRGTVALKEDLASVSVSSKTATLTLNLTIPELPAVHLRFPDGLAALENWYSALIDEKLVFPPSRLAPPIVPPPVQEALTTTMKKPFLRPTKLSSLKLPLDTVVLVPTLSGGGPTGSKFTALRYALKALVAEMGLFDRLAIVPYGSNSRNNNNSSGSGDGPPGKCHALAPGTWRHWSSFIEALAPAASARGRIKADLTTGVAAALEVLETRKTRNPITSIVIVSDSSLAPAGVSSSFGCTSWVESELLERASAAGVALHGLGVSTAHNAEALRALAPDSYCYVRRWAELGATLVGLYRGIAAAAHRNVVVRIAVLPGSNSLEIVDETRPTGYQPGSQTTVTVKSSPLTCGNSSLDDCASSQKHKVKIDMLLSGESRTFLVQTPVPPSGRLFEVCASSAGQQMRANRMSTHIATVRVVTSNNSQNSFLQHGPTPIIYGNPMAHVQVSRRRVQIAAMCALEALAYHPASSASSALPAATSSGLAFIAALRTALLTHPYSLIGGSRLVTDADAAALSEVARLVDVLDSLCAEAVAARDGNRAAFEQDVRKLLLQGVGVLNKERAYTLRTPLEGLFLQRQVLSNVI